MWMNIFKQATVRINAHFQGWIFEEIIESLKKFIAKLFKQEHSFSTTIKALTGSKLCLEGLHFVNQFLCYTGDAPCYNTEFIMQTINLILAPFIRGSSPSYHLWEELMNFLKSPSGHGNVWVSIKGHLSDVLVSKTAGQNRKPTETKSYSQAFFAKSIQAGDNALTICHDLVPNHTCFGPQLDPITLMVA